MSKSKELSVLERIGKLSKEAPCPVLQMCSVMEEELGDWRSCSSLLVSMGSLEHTKKLQNVFP